MGVLKDEEKIIRNGYNGTDRKQFLLFTTGGRGKPH